MNVKLKQRLKRKNTRGRIAYYWPRAISLHKNLEPGTKVYCLEDAIGDKPKMVKVMKYDDRAYSEHETFVVLMEDLTTT